MTKGSVVLEGNHSRRFGQTPEEDQAGKHYILTRSQAKRADEEPEQNVTCDSPVDDRSVLKLDGDGLVIQLHQKPEYTQKSATRVEDRSHEPPIKSRQGKKEIGRNDKRHSPNELHLDSEREQQTERRWGWEGGARACSRSAEP